RARGGRLPYCIVCKGQHSAFDRRCPAAQEQYTKSGTAYQNRALGFDLTRIQAVKENQIAYPPPTAPQARVMEKKRGRPPKRQRGEEAPTETQESVPPIATLDSFFAGLPSSFPSIIPATQAPIMGQPTTGLGDNDDPQE